MRRIKIFDTTLRDGEQSPGIALRPSEKAAIAGALEHLLGCEPELPFHVQRARRDEHVDAAAGRRTERERGCVDVPFGRPRKRGNRPLRDRRGNRRNTFVVTR